MVGFGYCGRREILANIRKLFEDFSLGVEFVDDGVHEGPVDGSDFDGFEDRNWQKQSILLLMVAELVVVSQYGLPNRISCQHNTNTAFLLFPCLQIPDLALLHLDCVPTRIHNLDLQPLNPLVPDVADMDNAPNFVGFLELSDHPDFNSVTFEQ